MFFLQRIFRESGKGRLLVIQIAFLSYEETNDCDDAIH